MFVSLHYRPFRYLWTGTLLWAISRWMETIVIGWLVLDMTGSPFMVGVVTAARGFPFLFFGALGGVVADRVPSRPQLLVAAQLAASMLTLLLAFLTITGMIQVWHLIIITFLVGTAMAFDQPTRQTLVYDLVGDNLVNALALNSSAFNLARILGPAAGGLLLGWVGPAGCFIFMAICSFVGMGSILLMGDTPRVRSAQVGSVWQNLKDGLGYVLSNPVTRTLLLLEAITDFAALPYIFVLMPVFARDVLAVGATGLGLMTASVGVGALSGALWLALMGNRLPKGPTLIASALFYGLFLLLFSLSPWYPLSLVLLALTGAATSIQVTLEATLLQVMVAEEMRGRVMGAYVLTWGFMPIGNLQAGAVATLAGAPFAAAAGGLVLAVFAVGMAWTARSLRRA
ncbi:MAG: MFS transporter [Dehalococcoidia bacterium]|nr:MFS transporter [Dehalococcoidia bacterium]